MDETPLPTVRAHLERHELELQALHWIVQAANFTMPVDDIMELIYTQTQRILQSPDFYIALANPERTELSYAFYVEGSERLYPGIAWPATTGLTGQVMKTGEVIRTADYVQECAARGIEPSGRLDRAWLGAPLMAGDQIIGVMVACSQKPELRFSEEDERFFVAVAAFTASAIERRRLQDRLEARAHQLNTLNEIGRLLASSLNIDEVLDLVVRNAVKLLNAEAGSLLLLDEASGDLIFRVSCGPLGNELVGRKIPAGKGIVGAAFAENRPIIITDAHRDPRWYAGVDRSADFVTRSILAIPLNARGNTIGVLEVLNTQDGHPFNQEDAELLLAFGAQAAIAIENARLFTMTDQALQARVEELTTLQHIDRMLNSSLNYTEVMNLTLEWATRITGAPVGMIAALHEDEDGTRGLRVLAYRGYPPDVLEPYKERQLWPLERGLVGATVRTGQVTLVPDVSADARYEALMPDMRTQLTIPIQRENRVIGVIALEAAGQNAFSPQAVDFVCRFAEHAAIAIDNARLFQQVQHANQAKTEFVSFVSHELKQPMTSMKGYTDLLVKGLAGPLTEQQQQFIEIIRKNIQHMDRLVQDLLDISRIESGRLQLDMRPLQPAQLVEEALQSFEQAIAERRQTLRVELQPDLPSIVGDRGRLMQVLTNLLSNAVKYTPEEGHITVRGDRYTTDGKTWVRWQVEDSGIGMTPEELEKLFTKYFRSQHPLVRSVRGTGLGLAISRSIVELHGGRISAVSAAEKGSIFTVLLPAKL